MKIAIDIFPLKSAHKVRGVGFYLEHLKNSLIKYCPENEYNFFVRGEKIPKETEVVHFPYFEPFFLARPLYRSYKSVVTVHDLTPIVFSKHFPRGIRGEIKWQMQRLSLKKASAIITDSVSSKKDVQKYIGIPESRIFVVYLAAGEQFKVLKLSEEKKDKIRKKHNLPSKFMLYVGDVTWNKNLPRLVHAARSLEIPLVMIGKALVSDDYDKNNPWNEDLIRVQQLAEVDENIIRLGFISNEDLIELYNLADLFVMPSLYEGFGLPVLEAMSCGCPVLTSKKGSLEEVAGDAAYFVDPYDQMSIERGIKKVFQDENLKRELVKRGLERVKHFSWKKTAKETLSVYETVVSRKR